MLVHRVKKKYDHFTPKNCLKKGTRLYQAQLRWQPIVILLTLSVIWGATWAVVKIGSNEIAPLFMAGIRSLVAGICLYIWIRIKKVEIFPSRIALFHGIIIGLLFGVEFAFIYISTQHTLVSRLYVLLYLTPFFVAIGAHFFLKGDKLNRWKLAGLALAFMGIAVLFRKDLGAASMEYLPGDILAVMAAALWGTTTIYIKRYLSRRAVPLQILFYQLLFSAPLLFLLSFIFEDFTIIGFSPATAFSVFYQCIIIAFLSYVVWFELIHRYPVSLLHAFSNFTPVFGVLLGGVIILGEPLTKELIVSLLMICLGMVFVNYQPAKNKKSGSSD